ncbi:hypothetical protein LOZ03_006655, partial [Ophidiomyces ophidiicola]
MRSSNLRQTRTNPSRQSKTAGRTSMMHHASTGSFSHVYGHGSGSTTYPGGPQYPNNAQSPGLYPGIHHFTDAIDALPREFRRHTSLLNEVDGKAFVLEAQLPILLQNAAELLSSPFPVMNGLEGTSLKGFQEDVLRTEQPEKSTARRQTFQNIRNTLNDLLPTMDEKNHVTRNAYLSLRKDMNRLEMIYPFVEKEVSDEARLGSRTHWAYLTKPAKPTGPSGSERPRREVATREHRDAAQDESTQRETRRETTGVRKPRRTQAEIEADESRSRKTNYNAKSRAGAPAEFSQVDQTAIIAPVPKRRRVEKPPPTPTFAVMERSASVATNTGAGRSGVKESPAPESGKRRARAQNAAASRKRTNTINSALESPSLAPSPVVSSLNHLGKTSTPPPNASNRPQSARIPQSATVLSNGRQRPSSSTSNRNLNSNKGILDSTLSATQDATCGSRVEPVPYSPPAAPDPPSASASVPAAVTATSKAEAVHGDEIKADSLMITHPGDRGSQRPVPITVGTSATTKLEPQDTALNQSPVPPSVTSKGRSSKTSTPVASTFPESQRSSRPSRSTAIAAAEGSAASKHSHKKGVAVTGAATTARQLALAAAAAEDEDSSRHGDDEDDEGEPRYCYCNQVSFGEMVACDMDSCPREWFHLSCVGLTKPPSKSVKWYCNECKETMKKGKSNG